MTARWEYRLRYTNLAPGEGRADAVWRDVGTFRVQNVLNHSVLEFRPKPARRHWFRTRRQRKGARR